MHRYNSEDHRRRGEKIYRLRQQGHSLRAISRQLGMNNSHVSQIYANECKLRRLAFCYPIVDYLSARIVKAIRIYLDEEILEDPEKLCDPDIIRTLKAFPAVGEKSMTDLAKGLAEAGYELFDLEKVKEEGPLITAQID